MNKVIYVFILLFISPIRAQEALESRMLSLGSCMVSFNKESVWLSSFNEYSARRVTFFELDEYMSEQIKKELGGPFKDENLQGTFDYSVHCGAYGLSLITKFKSNNVELCIWSKLELNEFKTRSMGLLGKSEALSDICHGKKFGDLLLQINDREFENVLLKDQKWSQIIKSYRNVSNQLVKIELEESYWMKEEQIREELMQDFKKYIKSIDLNGYTHPRGELINLK